ncbi:MAG: macrolide transporter subunit MacA [Phyllobacterium sp.]
MQTTQKNREDEKPNLTVVPGPTRAKPVRKRPRRWLWLPVVLVLAGTAYYGWTNYAQTTPASGIVTDVVTRGNIENSVTAVGTLAAIKDVEVGAQVSGQLTGLHVEIGDAVKQGDLIAEIDPKSIQNRIEIDEAELANLKAQLVNKEAQLVLKKASAARQRSLVASRSVSQSAVDEADAALIAAQADVDATKAQIRKQQATLDGDRVDLGYTKIYAPMSGTILAQSAKEGQTLNANQTTPTIVTMGDLSTMTVEAKVSEADVGNLKVGMDAYFTLLGQPDKRFTGKLRQIRPTPDTENNVVLYYALFDVPNPDGALMIDMSAQVFFVVSSAKDVLTVPPSALISSRGADRKPAMQVNIVTASGATETRDVEVGIRNRVRVEIRSGVAEGEKIIVGSSDGGAGRNASSRNRGMRMPPPMF